MSSRFYDDEFAGRRALAGRVSVDYDDHEGRDSAEHHYDRRRSKMLTVGLPALVVAATAIAVGIALLSKKKRSAEDRKQDQLRTTLPQRISLETGEDGRAIARVSTEPPLVFSSADRLLHAEHGAPPVRSGADAGDGIVTASPASPLAEIYQSEEVCVKEGRRQIFHCDEDNVCRLMDIEMTVTEEEEASLFAARASLPTGGAPPALDPSRPDYERLKKQVGLTRKISSALALLPWFGEVPSEVKIHQSNLAIPLLPPVTYEEAIRSIKPFDLYCTRGHTVNSKVIQLVEQLSRGCDACTHVGIFIDTSVVRLNGMVDGEMYVVESVIGGNLIPGTDPVFDIAGDAINGVQIRNLREMMVAEEFQTTFFAWASLKPEFRDIINRNVGLHVTPPAPRASSSQMATSATSGRSLLSTVAALIGDALTSQRDTAAPSRVAPGNVVRHIPGKVNAHCAFTNSISKYLGKPYPSNASNFIFGMTPFKTVSSLAAKCMSDIGDDYYCSELCANLYAEVGALPKSIIGETARTIYPVDFIASGHPSMPIMFESYRVIGSPLMPKNG